MDPVTASKVVFCDYAQLREHIDEESILPDLGADDKVLLPQQKAAEEAASASSAATVSNTEVTADSTPEPSPASVEEPTEQPKTGVYDV